MKLLNIYIFAAILLLLNSCQTSDKPTAQTVHSNSTELNQTEQKSYQSATEDIRAGHTEAAIQALTKITNNHPNHVGAWINLANAYLTAKKIHEAENALIHAQAIKPAIAETLNLQGLIQIEKGEYNKAEKSYLGAIQLNENYAFAHYNLALLYDIFYQDPDKALIQYERYLQLNSDDKNTKNWITELKQKINLRNKP